MDGPADLAKTEDGVESNTVRVVKLRIAGNFRVAVRTGPIFDELQQRATDAAVAYMFCHEPAFEIGNGRGRGAFDMIAANRKFRHADDFIAKPGERDDAIAGQKLLNFERMAIGRAFRPKSMAQSRPRFGVFGGGDENFDFEIIHVVRTRQ